MTTVQMLNHLVHQARLFRGNAGESLLVNHNISVYDSKPSKIIDAVLVDFINNIAASQGIPKFGLRTKDLEHENSQ